MNNPQNQYRAFIALLAATLVIALAPIVVSGILGKALPDALIATSDKAVTGFVTLLGTVGGLLFRQGRADEAAAEAARANAETGRILADKAPPQTVTPPSEPLSTN